MVAKNSSSILIILPVHNEGKYIERALNSILMQTHTKWTLFCQDNASQDNTFEIISRYSESDSRINIRKRSDRVNAAESSLSAASWALNSDQSLYVTWFSGDDFWIDNDYLEKLLRELEFSTGLPECIAVPKFLLQSEEKPSSHQTFELSLNFQSRNRRLRKFIKSWLNVCVMYGLYRRTEFEKLCNSEKSRFSAYLGSDWWWSYFAVKDCKLISVDVTFRKTHHEAGWRHDESLTREAKNIWQKTTLHFSLRYEFFWKHFILEKNRYNLVQDFWVIVFAGNYFISTFTHLLKTTYLFLSKSLRIKNRSA